MLNVKYVEIYDIKCSDNFFEDVFDVNIFEFFNIPTYYQSIDSFINRISNIPGFSVISSCENIVIFNVDKNIEYYKQIDCDHYIKKEYLFDEEIEVEFY